MVLRTPPSKRKTIVERTISTRQTSATSGSGQQNPVASNNNPPPKSTETNYHATGRIKPIFNPTFEPSSNIENTPNLSTHDTSQEPRRNSIVSQPASSSPLIRDIATLVNSSQNLSSEGSTDPYCGFTPTDETRTKMDSKEGPSRAPGITAPPRQRARSLSPTSIRRPDSRLFSSLSAGLGYTERTQSNRPSQIPIRTTVPATIGHTYPAPYTMPPGNMPPFDWTALMRAIRAPALEPPHFSGNDHEDPEVFLRECETFFAQSNIEQSQWTRLAGKALREPASKWWETFKSLSLTWDKFREMLRQKYASNTNMMRLNAQLYSKKQVEKEPVTVFLQQKYLLALRLLPNAEEEVIVPILLESLRPAIRRVIRAASPRTFGELLDRAVEAELDEIEDQPRKETKKEDPRKSQVHQRLTHPEDDRRRNAPPCHYCPEYHYHRDCPVFRAERRNALPQENWRSSAAKETVEQKPYQDPQQ